VTGIKCSEIKCISVPLISTQYPIYDIQKNDFYDNFDEDNFVCVKVICYADFSKFSREKRLKNLFIHDNTANYLFPSIFKLILQKNTYHSSELTFYAVLILCIYATL
jgi:hypothetical protein